jgi:cytochrome b subunit of formate dehydrogenase
MWDGTVDVNWAKEHHSLWVDEIRKLNWQVGSFGPL